jgi:hypothetical protein
MGASTNMTTVLWGTAWTFDTLLAQTIHHLQRIQARDGRRRVFKDDADRVGAEAPACAAYIAGEDEAEGDTTSRLLLANRKRDAATLYGKILALAHHWHATFVVVDATEVGAGLDSFLEKALRDRLIAVQFIPRVESELGWDLGSSRPVATATRWRTPGRTRASSGTKLSTASLSERNRANPGQIE